MVSLPKENESGIEIGVDEAGRGCLWGSMFAAAVLLETDTSKWSKEFLEVIPQIKDSKKVTALRRKKLYKLFQECGLVYGIGEVTAKEIDEWGATRANQFAFRRALDAIPIEKRQKAKVIIDGTLSLHQVLPGEDVSAEVDGDVRFLTIATASIIAKEAHDEWVRAEVAARPELNERYGLGSNMGYGTAAHIEGLKAWGADTLHRRSFAPVREVSG